MRATTEHVWGWFSAFCVFGGWPQRLDGGGDHGRLGVRGTLPSSVGAGNHGTRLVGSVYSVCSEVGPSGSTVEATTEDSEYAERFRVRWVRATTEHVWVGSVYSVCSVVGPSGSAVEATTENSEYAERFRVRWVRATTEHVWLVRCILCVRWLAPAARRWRRPRKTRSTRNASEFGGCGRPRNTSGWFGVFCVFGGWPQRLDGGGDHGRLGVRGTLPSSVGAGDHGTRLVGSVYSVCSVVGPSGSAVEATTEDSEYAERFRVRWVRATTEHVWVGSVYSVCSVVGPRGSAVEATTEDSEYAERFRVRWVRATTEHVWVGSVYSVCSVVGPSGSAVEATTENSEYAERFRVRWVRATTEHVWLVRCILCVRWLAPAARRWRRPRKTRSTRNASEFGGCGRGATTDTSGWFGVFCVFGGWPQRLGGGGDHGRLGVRGTLPSSVGAGNHGTRLVGGDHGRLGVRGTLPSSVGAGDHGTRLVGSVYSVCSVVGPRGSTVEGDHGRLGYTESSVAEILDEPVAGVGHVHAHRTSKPRPNPRKDQMSHSPGTAWRKWRSSSSFCSTLSRAASSASGSPVRQ